MDIENKACEKCQIIADEILPFQMGCNDCFRLMSASLDASKEQIDRLQNRINDLEAENERNNV